MSLQDIKNSIRNVPNFPKVGIQFKDITTALKQANVLNEIIEQFAAHYQNEKIDYIAGIESRGFILGVPLAYRLKCGFIPIRKKGKLPAPTLKQEYTLEYGTDEIEIHQDAFQKGDKVLIVDDLLATGGTARAASQLIKQAQADLIGSAFLIELKDLNGSKKVEPFAPVFSLISY